MTDADQAITDFVHWLAKTKRGMLESYILPSGRRVFGPDMHKIEDLLAEYHDWTEETT